MRIESLGSAVRLEIEFSCAYGALPYLGGASTVFDKFVPSQELAFSCDEGVLGGAESLGSDVRVEVEVEHAGLGTAVSDVLGRLDAR